MNTNTNMTESGIFMGLLQKKLTRSEWNTIEIPVNKTEKDRLELIIEGFKNVNIKKNKTLSLFTYLKIEYTENIEDYLYEKYFQSRINKMRQVYKEQVYKEDPYNIPPNLTHKNITDKRHTKTNIKSIDKMRLERYDEKSLLTNDLYDFILLNIMENIFYKNQSNNT